MREGGTKRRHGWLHVGDDEAQDAHTREEGRPRQDQDQSLSLSFLLVAKDVTSDHRVVMLISDPCAWPLTL
jgi:hypothetical protein